MWGYNDDVQDYTYDPEKAKALLKEAGLEKGFSIDLWAMPVQRPYNPNARRMAEMIQADWAKVACRPKSSPTNGVSTQACERWRASDGNDGLDWR